MFKKISVILICVFFINTLVFSLGVRSVFNQEQDYFIMPNDYDSKKIVEDDNKSNLSENIDDDSSFLENKNNVNNNKELDSDEIFDEGSISEIFIGNVNEEQDECLADAENYYKIAIYNVAKLEEQVKNKKTNRNRVKKYIFLNCDNNFKKAIELNLNYIDAYIDRGLFCIQYSMAEKGKDATAIVFESLNKALDLEPNLMQLNKIHKQLHARSKNFRVKSYFLKNCNVSYLYKRLGDQFLRLEQFEMAKQNYTKYYLNIVKSYNDIVFFWEKIIKTGELTGIENFVGGFSKIFNIDFEENYFEMNIYDRELLLNKNFNLFLFEKYFHLKDYKKKYIYYSNVKKYYKNKGVFDEDVLDSKIFINSEFAKKFNIILFEKYFELKNYQKMSDFYLKIKKCLNNEIEVDKILLTSMLNKLGFMNKQNEQAKLFYKDAINAVNELGQDQIIKCKLKTSEFSRCDYNFKKAIELNLNYIDAYIDRGIFCIGYSMTGKGNDATAIAFESLNKSLDLEPNLMQLNKIHKQLHNYKKNLRMHKYLLENCNASYFYKRLGDQFLRLGLFERAKQNYKKYFNNLKGNNNKNKKLLEIFKYVEKLDILNKGFVFSKIFDGTNKKEYFDMNKIDKKLFLEKNLNLFFLEKHLGLKEYDNAKEYFNKIKKFYEAKGLLRHDLFHLDQTKMYIFQGCYWKAKGYYLSNVSDKRRYPFPEIRVKNYKIVGIDAFYLGFYKEAVGCYDQYITINPSDPEIYYLRAIANIEVMKEARVKGKIFSLIESDFLHCISFKSNDIKFHFERLNFYIKYAEKNERNFKIILEILNKIFIFDLDEDWLNKMDSKVNDIVNIERQLFVFPQDIKTIYFYKKVGDKFLNLRLFEQACRNYKKYYSFFISEEDILKLLFAKFNFNEDYDRYVYLKDLFKKFDEYNSGKYLQENLEQGKELYKKDLCVFLVKTCIKFKQYADGLSYLNAITFLSIEDAEFYYLRAIINKKLGCLHNIYIDDLNKAIEINPDYIDAYIERGFCDNMLFDDLGKALELQPNRNQLNKINEKINNNLGYPTDLYRKIGDKFLCYDNYDKAILNYKKYIKIINGQYEELESYKSLGWLNKNRDFISIKNYYKIYSKMLRECKQEIGELSIEDEIDSFLYNNGNRKRQRDNSNINKGLKRRKTNNQDGIDKAESCVFKFFDKDIKIILVPDSLDLIKHKVIENKDYWFFNKKYYELLKHNYEHNRIEKNIFCEWFNFKLLFEFQKTIFKMQECSITNADVFKEAIMQFSDIYSNNINLMRLKFSSLASSFKYYYLYLFINKTDLDVLWTKKTFMENQAFYKKDGERLFNVVKEVSNMISKKQDKSIINNWIKYRLSQISV